ncbi:MAG: Gfo/Idh/MocA family oxidoreductase [candidate division KSB1 bacterium]|nr:Gfo/Idh/MocA family oxidoreductase [candidate division KSB1 bacterium]
MVRIAILGYGFMGRAHLAQYLKLPAARVVAVVDSNPERFQALVRGNLPAGESGASLEGIACFTRMDDVLGRPDVDVVDVCLPTHLHKDAVLRALEAGHDVICEKPLALSLRDVDEILEAAARSGHQLMVALCIRFWPEYEYLQDVVRTGAFGRPVSALFRRISPFPSWGGSDSWFADPSRSGGVLLDLHIHDVDISQVLFGRPQRVFATAATGPAGGTRAVFAQHVYEGGPLVFLEASWAYAAFEMSYHVTFEAAEVRYSSSATPTLQVRSIGEDKTYTPELPQEDGYLRELRYFLQCLMDRRYPERVSHDSVRQAMEIALAEQQSMATGMPVEL